LIITFFCRKLWMYNILLVGVYGGKKLKREIKYSNSKKTQILPSHLARTVISGSQNAGTCNGSVPSPFRCILLILLLMFMHYAGTAAFSKRVLSDSPTSNPPLRVELLRETLFQPLNLPALLIIFHNCLVALPIC